MRGWEFKRVHLMGWYFILHILVLESREWESWTAETPILFQFHRKKLGFPRGSQLSIIYRRITHLLIKNYLLIFSFNIFTKFSGFCYVCFKWQQYKLIHFYQFLSFFRMNAQQMCPVSLHAHHHQLNIFVSFYILIFLISNIRLNEFCVEKLAYFCFGCILISKYLI